MHVHIHDCLWTNDHFHIGTLEREQYILDSPNIYVNTNKVAGGFGWSIVVVTLLVHQQRTDIYLDSITNVNL